MIERYEKRGSSIRLDISARGTSTIVLREGGWSRSSETGFSCGMLALRDGALQQPHLDDSLSTIASSVRRLARGLAVVERLTVVEGHAEHLFDVDARRRQWTESAARIFLTLVRQPCGRRASLSLGADSLFRVDLGPVESLCQALSRPESGAPHLHSTLLLEPWVAASLVRVLADERVVIGGGLRIVQRPPEGARDGRGRKIRRRVVRHSQSPWPECFRPSYRFAPSFVPLHAELLGSEPATFDGPLIVSSLASDWIRKGAVHIARVWVTDSISERISLCELDIDVLAMNRSTVQAAGDSIWFPEGAGAWGQRLILQSPAARLRSP